LGRLLPCRLPRASLALRLALLLHPGYTPAASRLHLGYISATSRLALLRLAPPPLRLLRLDQPRLLRLLLRLGRKLALRRREPAVLGARLLGPRAAAVSEGGSEGGGEGSGEGSSE